MTQCLAAINDMLLDRLAVMKAEINYHESLRDSYANEDNVIAKMTERFDKARKAYEILHDLITDGYETYGDFGEVDWFETEEA